MTGQHRPRRTDNNGIPKPVVKWLTTKGKVVARCNQCIWTQVGASLAEARLHVRTYPDHFVYLDQTTSTMVFAETTDGEVWVEAVNRG